MNNGELWIELSVLNPFIKYVAPDVESGSYINSTYNETPKPTTA